MKGYLQNILQALLCREPPNRSQSLSQQSMESCETHSKYTMHSDATVSFF